MVKSSFTDSAPERLAPILHPIPPESFFGWQSWTRNKVEYWCRIYGVDMPELRYRYVNRLPSSGCCYRTDSNHGRTRTGRLQLNGGNDVLDRRMVALHELAHWLSPVRKGHSPAFWCTAFDLYEAEFSSAELRDHIVPRESWYRAQAYIEAVERGLVDLHESREQIVERLWERLNKAELLHVMENYDAEEA